MVWGLAENGWQSECIHYFKSRKSPGTAYRKVVPGQWKNKNVLEVYLTITLVVARPLVTT